MTKQVSKCAVSLEAGEEEMIKQKQNVQMDGAFMKIGPELEMLMEAVMAIPVLLECMNGAIYHVNSAIQETVVGMGNVLGQQL